MGREVSPSPPDAPPPARRVTMPCNWGDTGLGEFTGRVRYQRSFGWVGRYSPDECVWLTFACVDRVADVWLNDHLLGRHDGAAELFEFEVTPLLRRRNELRLEVDAAGGQGGICGEVALEVRAPAFAKALRWWVDESTGQARLHVTGECVGVADRPLELYVLLDGSTVIYSTIEPQPTGRKFHVTSDVLSWKRADAGAAGPQHRIRIELVNISVIWYAVDGTLESDAAQTADAAP